MFQLHSENISSCADQFVVLCPVLDPVHISQSMENVMITPPSVINAFIQLNATTDHFAFQMILVRGMVYFLKI